MSKKKSGSKSSAGAKAPKGVKALLLLVGAIAVVTFAVQGGEYGTLDLLRQRAQTRKLVGQIDSLQRVVDSLKRYRKRLDSDPALQERIAREEFGLVRGDREILYRFAGPARADSGVGVSVKRMGRP